MIYLDTSVALAWLLGEDRHPPESLWTRPLASSRLLEYELWTRLHARGLGGSAGVAAADLLGRVMLVELAPQVLARSLDPFPTPVRTLDALHLATAAWLHQQGRPLSLASYDTRMLSAAAAIGLPVAEGMG